MCIMSNENSTLENKNIESSNDIILDVTEDILLENSCDGDLKYFNTAKHFHTP